MTFCILKAYAWEPKLMLNKKFIASYVLQEFLLEHEHRSEGFVFKESELEAYVAMSGKDPVSMSPQPIQNVADNIVDVLRNGEIVAFAVVDAHSSNHIIAQNYTRYMIFAKKHP